MVKIETDFDFGTTFRQAKRSFIYKPKKGRKKRIEKGQLYGRKEVFGFSKSDRTPVLRIVKNGNSVGRIMGRGEAITVKQYNRLSKRKRNHIVRSHIRRRRR